MARLPPVPVLAGLRPGACPYSAACRAAASREVGGSACPWRTRPSYTMSAVHAGRTSGAATSTYRQDPYSLGWALSRFGPELRGGHALGLGQAAAGPDGHCRTHHGSAPLLYFAAVRASGGGRLVGWAPCLRRAPRCSSHGVSRARPSCRPRQHLREQILDQRSS